MRRPVGVQATRCLLELAFTPRPVASTRVMPGDRDVHKPLQEVALGRGRVAPLVFELLVGVEVLATSNQR